MLVLLGESGSGKSTIEKYLIKHHTFRKIISYTTRPPRDNEVDGVDYHFINEEKFKELDKKHFFMETSVYNSWYYGIAEKDFVEPYPYNKLVILTPSGLRQLKKMNVKKDLGIIIISCYIKVDRRERLIRVLNRGDNVDEAIRRNISDVGQYDGIEKEAELIINNQYQPSLYDLTNNLTHIYYSTIIHLTAPEIKIK